MPTPKVWDGAAWVPTLAGPKGDKGDTGDSGSGVPAGGTTGQVLVKQSATDGDAGWAAPDVTQAELDVVDGKAVAAQGDATQALTNAATADGKAVNAQSTANDASLKADTAQADATQALTNAAAAQADATQALSDSAANTSNLTTKVDGDGDFTTMTKLTQAQYDGLAPPDANTLYIVVG